MRFGELGSFRDWILTKTTEIARFVESAQNITDSALIKAAGPPGLPGNVEEIIYAARRLGQVYRRLLEWAAEFKHAESDDVFDPALKIVSRLSPPLISEFEEFGRVAQQSIEEAVRRFETTGERQEVTVRLKLTCPHLDGFDDELRKLARHFGMAN